uniref:DNA topoisomerase n=1 Tax=Streptococcus oralis TaxID=1303 RepID=UPI0021F0C185
GMNGKKMKLTTKEEVREVLSHLTRKDFTVEQEDKKERKRNAPLPYTTSTMQMDASNKINFRTRKTMMVAQQRYEVINIGSGVQGLITYMRTDS